MRCLPIVMLAMYLAACSPPPQAPASSNPTPAEAPTASEYDPQRRARAVEEQTLQQFERQNEALEKQGG